MRSRPTPKSTQDWEELHAGQEAEITRLNAFIESMEKDFVRRGQLITELATALAVMDPNAPHPDIEQAIPWIQKLPGLLNRAKEETES